MQEGGGGFEKGILSSVSILSLNFFNANQPNTKSLQKLLTIGMSEPTDIWFSRTCNHKDNNGFLMLMVFNNLPMVGNQHICSAKTDCQG